MTRCGARRSNTQGLDAPHPLAAIFPSPMKVSLVRFVFLLLLGGQLLPAGLPLLCDQAHRNTPANCAQQMSASRSGRTMSAATQATPCASAALCATAASAALPLSAPPSMTAPEPHGVGYGVVAFVPIDPRAPVPPPPQA